MNEAISLLSIPLCVMSFGALIYHSNKGSDAWKIWFFAYFVFGFIALRP